MKWSKPKGSPGDNRQIEIWVEQICSKNAPSFFSRIIYVLDQKFSFSRDPVILDLKLQLA